MPPRKSAKTRLDQALCKRGLAKTTSEAQGLIMAGKVVVGDQRIDKAGHMVADEVEIRIKGDLRFASRAGDKLFGVVDVLRIAHLWDSKVVLDVGASTGGFTDVSLALNAAKVIALDVGTNQLAWELRQDSRVISVEQTDIRDFDRTKFADIDLVIGDVSFTSLARLAPALREAAPRVGVHFLLLVKPQFELPRDVIPDGGIVKDEDLRRLAVQSVSQAMAAVGIDEIAVSDSPVPGRQGNVEIFWFGISKSQRKDEPLT